MRTKKACSGPGAFAAAQAASTSIARAWLRPILLIRAVMGGAETGLAHARVEPEIAHQLLRAGETADIADRRHQPRRNRQIDTGDRHQPLDRHIVQRTLRDLAVEDVEVLGETVKLTDMPLDRGALVVGNQLARQPCPAAPVEQIRVRTLRDQMRMQDRVYLVLEPGPVPHHLVAPRHQTAQPLGRRVRRPRSPADSPPHTGSPASPRRPCRSSHGHARSPSPATDWRSQPASRKVTARGRPPCSSPSPRSPPRPVARKLRPKPSSPVRVMSTRPAWCRAPFSQITTSPKVRWMSMPMTRRIRASCGLRGGSGGQHDTYGSALSAQPGESQRRPATNTSSQLIEWIGLPAPSCSRCLCPGWSHHRPNAEESGRGQRHRHLHTGYQPARTPPWRDQAANQCRRHLPKRGRHHPPDRRYPGRAERRMGGPESPIHDAGVHRSDRRQCLHQAARCGGLSDPARPAGCRVERKALTPHPGTRSSFYQSDRLSRPACAVYECSRVTAQAASKKTRRFPRS